MQWNINYACYKLQWKVQCHTFELLNNQTHQVHHLDSLKQTCVLHRKNTGPCLNFYLTNITGHPLWWNIEPLSSLTTFICNASNYWKHRRPYSNSIMDILKGDKMYTSKVSWRFYTKYFSIYYDLWVTLYLRPCFQSFINTIIMNYNTLIKHKYGYTYS